MKTIGVVGAGQMGSGIAQLGIVHGFHVWLLDSDSNALTRATKSISISLQRFLSKGQLSQVICATLILSFLHIGFISISNYLGLGHVLLYSSNENLVWIAGTYL